MTRWIANIAVGLAIVAPASADYYSHPELRPEDRCSEIPAGIGHPEDPGGPGSIHCQKLFWDLPVVLEVGKIGVAKAFLGDSEPRFPRGITDRPPPIWRGDTDGDGIADEGFEREADCHANASGCERLCEDPLMIPYWQELLDEESKPLSGGDDFGLRDAKTGDPIHGPQFQVACAYGDRSYYGPWQTAATVDPLACKAYLDANSGAEVIDGPCGNGVFDRLATEKGVRFDNTARLDYFEQELGTDRREWNTGSEYYNHYGSHHGTCYQPNHACANPDTSRPREDFQEGGACWDYTSSTYEGSECYAADANPECDDRGFENGPFRNATQIPGRLSIGLPDGRGVLSTEQQIWNCNHHVVTQLPPGSYGITDRFINYRLQTRGVRNDADRAIWDTAPGAFYGGAVGEMLIQSFAEPQTADVKPLNIAFNALADAATTYYPPFTWNYHESEWLPPFDALIGLNSIHSHHRMVKGMMNVAPVNPLRPNAQDPNCGGPGPNGLPTDLYTSWEWEDAPVCQYWKEADGAVPIRKGQALRTSCYVNNGVTPEAIKHGLVAGATLEVLKALGAPIPDYPEAMGEASTWGDPLVASPVGQELLYGTHPPINYRVVYKCSHVGPVPGTSVVQAPLGSLSTVCTPNPAKDANGDYIDGGYYNEDQCGGGFCEPSSVIFACIGEDEMCIGVSMYWAMPRLGSDDEAMENLTSGNPDDLNDVGTPGSLGIAPTEAAFGGSCPECSWGP